MTQTTTATQPAELAAALRPVLLRLSRRIRQERDESVELTPSQLSALGLLDRHGDLPIGALAELERVRPPSMTRVVNALEERGVVVRNPSPDDRRQAVVSITAEGRRLVLANRRLRTEWLATRLAMLDPAERQTLADAAMILEKVHA